MELQIQSRGEERFELRRKRWACGAESQWVQYERDDQGSDGPESDGEREESTRTRKIKLFTH